ncbi:hypothetical protein SUGI_0264640 [Cryptomeria japonica]|nr:hypothetical protein SUGI_0264640 [Cryptomeria japonica]
MNADKVVESSVGMVEVKWMIRLQALVMVTRRAQLLGIGKGGALNACGLVNSWNLVQNGRREGISNECNNYWVLRV